MLRFHVIGQWRPGQVACGWVDSSYAPNETVRDAVERAWAEASARPGVHLFDGPMCRLEACHAHEQRLELSLSRTSYKQFMGTNMANPQLADQFGPAVLANPVGLSCALVSGDGLLLMGRRNERVAYYPGRVHPFAGALEPAEPVDVFEEIGRELKEELSLEPTEVREIRCVGMVEDRRLRQPELIFLAHALATRQQIEARLDAKEHTSIWILAANETSADAALSDVSQMTPVGVATLLLWGRAMFGENWFDRRHPYFGSP